MQPQLWSDADYILQTSIHSTKFEYFSSSGIVSSIALLLLPQAGKTVLNLFSDSSRYTVTPSLIPKGQTPPIPCPIRSFTSSGFSILAFAPKKDLYLWLSIFASPAVTIKIALSPSIKDNVFAMRHGSVFRACAASSTVALDS